MKKMISNFHLTRDGEQIYYATNFEPNDEESNDVLVFNYGLVCSTHHWKEQISYFDKLGYKILLHDYRGHFKSSGKQNLSAISFENISIDIYELLISLKIKKSIHLGHSMGVNISLEFARRFPKLVSKLILISGTTLPVQNIMFHSNITDYLIPKAKKILDQKPDLVKNFWKYSGWNPFVKSLVHSGGFNTEKVSKEFIEIYLNRVGELGPDLFFQLIGEMRSHDILSFTNQIKAKTLIISGDKDKVIPNYLQRHLQTEISGSDLYIVKNGSHVPQVDFPDLINERIELFITS